MIKPNYFQIIILTTTIFCCQTTAFAQATKETLFIKDQLLKLQEDLSEQKELTSTVLEKLNESIKNQNQLILQFNETSKLIQKPSLPASPIKQQSFFNSTFILNKDGKPVALIDDNLKLYEFTGGNLIGWINPDTNEIVRNFDNSVVAVIENDFVLDETGHAIGSIEKSENLKISIQK